MRVIPSWSTDYLDILYVCRLNYLLGGFAAGGVFGAWKHNHVSGLTVGLFLGKQLLFTLIRHVMHIKHFSFIPR